MTGLNIGEGAQDITIRNCTFNGFANTIRPYGKRILITQCAFTENCEDRIKLSSPDNVTIEWCVFNNFRALNATQAGWLGWPDPVTPPHADCFQLISAGSNLTIRYNYLYDDTSRCHFGLLNSGKGNGGTANNIVVENNESQQTHATGWIASYINNLTFARNKTTGLNGANPYFQLVTSGAPAIVGTLTITNNEAANFSDGVTNGLNGNNKNNNPSHYPAGFVQIQKDNVTAGARYAGVGGNG